MHGNEKERQNKEGGMKRQGVRRLIMVAASGIRERTMRRALIGGRKRTEEQLNG